MRRGTTPRDHGASQAQVYERRRRRKTHEAGRLTSVSFAVFRGVFLRPLAAVAVVALAACAPKQVSHGLEPMGLDCSRAFEVLAHNVTEQPGLKPAPKDPAEPYRFYSTEDGATSYLVTEPGAPGHPAILMERARNRQVITTGCPYGDMKGYAQLLAYLDSLKTWTRK